MKFLYSVITLYLFIHESFQAKVEHSPKNRFTKQRARLNWLKTTSNHFKKSSSISKKNKALHSYFDDLKNQQIIPYINTVKNAFPNAPNDAFKSFDPSSDKVHELLSESAKRGLLAKQKFRENLNPKKYKSNPDQSNQEFDIFKSYNDIQVPFEEPSEISSSDVSSLTSLSNSNSNSNPNSIVKSNSIESMSV